MSTVKAAGTVKAVSRALHVVLPDSVDDPRRPSGGNTYDRRVCAELVTLGWTVQVHAAAGAWPRPEPHDLAAVSRELATVPTGSVVLVDGLVACGIPEVVVPAAARLRVVVLVHLPLGLGAAPRLVVRGEQAVLDSAAAILTTSRWTRRWLVDRYDLPPDRVFVAPPGVDAAEPAGGSPSGGHLLCVAAVVPAKGHAELLDALATVADLPWRLVCAGALDLAPDHVARLQARCRETGIADRVTFVGPVGGEDLARAYAAADVLLLASRFETYGLVVVEALARGLPVVATSVGGIGEAMGVASGLVPGLLVPPTGTSALGRAVRCWLEDAALRERLRAAALERRTRLAPWSTTARQVADVLVEVAA